MSSRLWLIGLILAASAPSRACASGRALPDPPVQATAERTPDEREPVPVPEMSPLARQYYRTGNWLWVFDLFWSMSIPVLLLFTGISARMRDLASRLGRTWFLTIGIFVVLYLVIEFGLSLPLIYYQGFVRQRAYGLSHQTFGRWLGHTLIRFGISVTVGFCFAWVPYLLLERRPNRWWLDLTLLALPFAIVVLMITPVWFDPLFNKVVPLADWKVGQKDEALVKQVLAQARRAGIAEGRICVVDKSKDTKALNAKVTGFLGTKRIVFWDTLLSEMTENEVLAVLGHEMGHYVLGHLSRSILLASLVVLGSLFWADRAGRWLIARFRDRFGFERLADVASFPLLILLLEIATFALLPAINAYSRIQEHQADCFALELTRTNRSAALAFIKLQQENLSNPRPGPLYRIWRSTHPSIGERIDFCNSYHPWSEGRPLRYRGWFRP